MSRIVRDYFWWDLSAVWKKVQERENGCGLKEKFTVKDRWPSITGLFYNKDIQRGLKAVVRWKNYRHFNGLRQQNDLQHSRSMPFLAEWSICRMNGKLPPLFDRELVYKAGLLHNLPEAISRQDIPFGEKTVADDVREYEIFHDLCRRLVPTKDILEVEKIYLLQFCLKEIKLFPPPAQALLHYLKSNYRWEAKLFQTLELLDYLLFAEEQYVRWGWRELLTDVVKLQGPLLNQAAAKFSAFSRSIWNAETRKYFSQFKNVPV